MVGEWQIYSLIAQKSQPNFTVQVNNNQSQVQQFWEAYGRRQKPPIVNNGVSDDGDPHKGAFGNAFVANWWYLSASVSPIPDEVKASELPDYRLVTVRVARLAEGEPVESLKLYLHPTFPESEVSLKVENDEAHYRFLAWAFTLGCILQPGDRQLELDLASNAVEAPSDWKAR